MRPVVTANQCEAEECTLGHFEWAHTVGKFRMHYAVKARSHERSGRSKRDVSSDRSRRAAVQHDVPLAI